MEERRKKMDDETREHFNKMNDGITSINLTLEKHVSRDEALALPSRMKEAEDCLDTKASWNGLYLVAILIVAICSAVIAFNK